MSSFFLGLDPYFDRVFVLVNRVGSPLAIGIALVAILIPALPVVALEIAFSVYVYRLFASSRSNTRT